MTMKKLSIGILILFLLGIHLGSIRGAYFSPMNSVYYNGNILYVGGTGPNNYTEIQNAINAAEDGDTIFVYKGIYSRITIYKELTIIGEDKENTIIDADEDLFIISIISPNVNVQNFTVRNGFDGITVEGKNCNIINNIITNFDRYGIYLYKSNNSIIGENQISAIFPDEDPTSEDSIYITRSQSVEIKYNNITNSSDGINLEESFGCNVSYNFIYNQQSEGMDIGRGSGHFIYCNTIDRCKILFGVYEAGDIYFSNNNFLNHDLLFGSLRTYKCRFDGNYWNKTRNFPKPIFGLLLYGYIGIIPLYFPLIQFDWHPATEPYDIIA